MHHSSRSPAFRFPHNFFFFFILFGVDLDKSIVCSVVGIFYFRRSDAETGIMNGGFFKFQYSVTLDCKYRFPYGGNSTGLISTLVMRVHRCEMTAE